MTAFRKEDVEKCKQKDLLEQMLKEMSGEFPELGRVFVKERDVYLTYSLQMATHHIPRRINSARKYFLRRADTLVYLFRLCNDDGCVVHNEIDHGHLPL